MQKLDLRPAHFQNSDKKSRFSSFLVPHESDLIVWEKGVKQQRALFHLALKRIKKMVTSYLNFGAWKKGAAPSFERSLQWRNSLQIWGKEKHALSERVLVWFDEGKSRSFEGQSSWVKKNGLLFFLPVKGEPGSWSIPHSLRAKANIHVRIGWSRIRPRCPRKKCRKLPTRRSKYNPQFSIPSNKRKQPRKWCKVH